MATISWGKTDGDDDCTFSINGVSYVIAPDSSALKYIYWDPASPNVFLATDSEATAKGGGDHWIVKIQESGALIETPPVKFIETPMVKANAITIPVSEYTAGNTTLDATYKNIESLVLASTGDPIQVWFSFLPIISQITSYYVRVYRDGTLLFDSGECLGLPAIVAPFSSMIKDSPAAGNRTYYLKAKRSDPGCIARNRSLFVIEIKK